jgi:hypothetical protein
MPKVIFEQLQYLALSPTQMCVQLANLTIQYPEGIVKNLLVRVNKSFVLTNFVVLDKEGDLDVQLILGRPFLRDAKARIDVRTSASASGLTTYFSNSNTGMSRAS